MHQTYPKLAIAIDVTMAVKCFGVATSYLIVIADLMPDATKFFVSAFGGTIDDNRFVASIEQRLTTLIHRFNSCLFLHFSDLLAVSVAAWSFLVAYTSCSLPVSFFISRTFWLLIFLVPAVVLASLKKLNEWHFTSYFAMATVVYILGLVCPPPPYDSQLHFCSVVAYFVVLLLLGVLLLSDAAKT